MRRFLVACSVFVTSACGGSGVAGGTGGTTGTGTGGGSSGGDCPDISGTWVITEHCESSFIDMTTQATQTGCSYTVVADAYTCTGTIDAAGVVDQNCDVEGGMHCAGGVDGSTLTLLCDGGCSVELERE
jgi:hypothetical protein